MAELKRGPKIGDSASLWNFTPSPGWTKEEVLILKLCLAKHGIGRWVQILDMGLLPGKLIQQLNGQTQRLLGQQSLAAYTGIKVDIDRIREDNNARTDVERKSGLIIRTGKNPTKKMRDEWQEEAVRTYGLTEEQLREVDEQLNEIQGKMSSVGGSGQTRQDISAPVISLMASEPTDLNRGQKLQLLRRLHQQLCFLHAKLDAGSIVKEAQQQGATESAAPAAEQNGEPIAAAAAPAAENATEVLLPVDANTATMEATEKAEAAQKASKEETGKGAAATAAKPKGRKRAAAAKGSAATGGRGQKRTKQRKTVEDMEEEQGEEVKRAARGAAAVAAENDLQQLVAMGFEAKKCREALEEAEGNLEAAVEFLFSACV